MKGWSYNMCNCRSDYVCNNCQKDAEYSTSASNSEGFKKRKKKSKASVDATDERPIADVIDLRYYKDTRCIKKIAS